MKLDDYLASPMGRAIQLVVDLDFALERGITVPLTEINYLEFRLLRLFTEERNRYQNDEIENRAKRPAS